MFTRIIYAILVFVLAWTLFLLFYFYLATNFSLPSPFSAAVALAVPTALPLSLTILFLERILKSFCEKWKYSKFQFIQRFSRTLVFIGSLGVIVILAVAFVFPMQLPLWAGLLLLILMLLIMFFILLTDFFSIVGAAVLCFRSFLWDFEKKADEADFGKLFLASKKISTIAKAYNMQVSPYSLSLGITVAFLENKDFVREDFENLIEWIEVSTETENFKNFREIVKKYNAIAENSTKHGIAEKSHLTFERFISLLGNILIPLAIAVIAVVVPKLLEMIS